MKFTKLSLIAALAVTSAVAGEGKIGGDVKLFYWTNDIGTNDLFNKNGAAGDAAVSLDYSRDIIDGVTVNAGVTGISTLGLEGTLVSGTNVPHGGTRSAAGTDDKVWIDTANIVLKPIDKTMLVVGRQTLDTPLAFTETWNIAHNTFDAAVAVDNHIENTTLIGAWVGRGNGHNGFENVDGGMSKYGAIEGGSQPLNKGAFAVAAITKAIPMTTAQLWFYNVRNQADAVWAQADIAPSKEVSVGLQYSQIGTKGAAAAFDDTKAFAAKLGYSANGLDLAGAYSEVDDKGAIYMGNTATGGVFANRVQQSKLYTEAWWNYGFVGEIGAKTAMISAGLGDFTAQYTTVSNDTKGAQFEMDEVTLTATHKIGPVDATVAFINTSSDNAGVDGNNIQAYLTVPFSL